MAFKMKKRPAARESMKGDAAGKKKRENDPRVCVTPVGRVGFCHVWEPHKFKDDDADSDKADKAGDYKISIVFEFEKSDEEFADVRRAIKAACYEKWGEAETKRLNRLGKLYLPFRTAQTDWRSRRRITV